MAPTDPLKSALTTNTAQVLFVGDSITYGSGVAYSSRWVQQVTADVRAAKHYTGSDGYVPITDGTSSDWTTGTAAAIGWGLGYRAGTVQSTSTYVWTGTGVDLYYTQGTGGGAFTAQIDSQTPVNLTSHAASAQFSVIQQFRGLTRGTHTLTVTAVPGPTIVEGAYFYDGDESTGFRQYDGAHASYTTTSFATNPTFWTTAVGEILPDAVLIALGTNDYGTGVNTPAQVATNLVAIIDDITSAMGGKPWTCLLCIPWQTCLTTTYSTFTQVDTWANYRSAIQSVASLRSNVSLVDLEVPIGPDGVYNGSDPNGWFQSDFIHPNAAGSTVIANFVNTNVFVPLEESCATSTSTTRTCRSRAVSDTVVSAPTLSSTSFAPCVSGVTAVTLYAASREYVSWTFQAGGTVTAVDVFLDAAWRSATVDGTVATLLLAGSGATGNPEGTIVLAAGTYDTLVRFTEAPELPVRPGGRITVIG